MPFFSIIISTKNRANLIKNAIKSILEQSFQDFEIIIIDNASTDNTEDIINNFNDKRITFLKNKIDKERCYARNRGIDNAKGKYICFLDSDDQFLPNHLDIIHKRIQEKPETALYFTNAYEVLNFKEKRDRLCPNIEDYNLFEYLLTFTFNPARVAIHKTILKEFNFDLKMPGLEDLDLWLRIASRYPIYQIKERTILYNLHEDAYSVDSFSRFKKELKLYRYVFKRNELKHILPVKSKKRLLSMCYYKMALTLNEEFKPFYIHYLILKAFILYPKGYNKNSNKTMFVIFIYQIPIFGFILKNTYKIFK